jgi:hypothetical protein
MMSATAPMVQKLTRLATAPNANASVNAQPVTSDGRWAVLSTSPE